MTIDALHCGKRAIIGICSLVASATAASAQSVARDPATGDYVVTYQIDGATFEARTESSGSIDPRLAIAVDRAASGVLRYTYTVTNEPSERAMAGHGVMVVDVACDAASDPEFEPSVDWIGEVEVRGGTTVCDVTRRMPHLRLEPGDPPSAFVITSPFLPGVVHAKVHGGAGLPIVPTNSVDTPDDVYRLLDQYGGYGFADSSGVALMTIGPARAPTAIANLAGGIDTLNADVGLACGSLAWIDNQGVCNSFRQKLNAASAAIANGNHADAQGSLNAYLRELDAQRGKHVSDNAYWLLKTNAEYVLMHL